MINPALSRQPFMRGSRLAIVATALAITVPLAVLAQSDQGSPSGTVIDSAGQAWAGARVTLSPVGQRNVAVRLKTEYIERQRVRLEWEDSDRAEVAGQKEALQRQEIVKWTAKAGPGNDNLKLEFIAMEHDLWTTRTDDNGRFEPEDVPPGEYELEVRLPGFSTVEETVTVAAGQHVQRQIAL